MMGGNNPEDDEGSLDSDSDLILDGENDSEDSDEDGKNFYSHPDNFLCSQNFICFLRPD